MVLLRTGSLSGALNGAFGRQVSVRQLFGGLRRRVLVGSAPNPAPVERRAEPYGFGNGARSNTPSEEPQLPSRLVDKLSEHASSSSPSEARTEAVEARLLQKLEAAGRSKGSTDRRSDGTPYASSSGRLAADDSGASAPGRGSGPKAADRPRGRGSAPASGVGPAKAERNASAKTGAPRERRPPVRSAVPGDGVSKRQAKRLLKASGAPTERLSKVSRAP